MNGSIKRERQLAGPWPDWPCRLLACGKAGGPVKPSARTCVSVLHKRERLLAAPRRELARAGTHREETAEALRRSVAGLDMPPSRLRQGRGAR